jgi:hypothetical protein
VNYRKEDYLHLQLVSNPESDFGFEVIESGSGRPIAGIVAVNVDRGIDQKPPYQLTPQKVTVTFVGIPVELSFPDWATFAARRQAAHERIRREADSQPVVPESAGEAGSPQPGEPAGANG